MKLVLQDRLLLAHRATRLLLRFALFCLVGGLAACAVPTTQGGSAETKPGGGPLIPVRQFVANSSFAANFKLSPDGERIAWQAASGTDAALHVAPTDQPERREVLAAGQIPRGAQHVWLNDNRHLVYAVDASGSENTALWIVDANAPQAAARRLTPWPGDVRAVFMGVGAPGSDLLYVASNQRDRAVFDLYSFRADDPTPRLVMQNDRRIQHWVFDERGNMAGWLRAGPQNLLLEVLDAAGGTPRELLRVPPRDSFRPVSLNRSAGTLLGVSNIRRDKLALVRIDLTRPVGEGGGALEVLAQDERVDLEGITLDQTSGRPLAVLSTPDFPRAQWLDTELEVQLAGIWRSGNLPRPLTIKIANSSRNGERMVLRPVFHQGEGEMLFDRKLGRLRTLRPLPSAQSPLVSVEPISLAAMDGTPLHGYLLRPREDTRAFAKVPLVVQVHGGPWARDSWTGGLGTEAQFLANRGYAVLMINYRGSSGYGKAFMESAIGQLGRATQDDITAAVRWAIGQGFADPKRIGIMGASFGGYSTLMQLIRQPDLYACGISQVGVANWPRLLDNAPPYWRDALPLWRRYLGDIRKPEERLRLLAESPVSQLDRIRAPLLVIHGQNDVRVARQDSDDVVAGLRARNAPVEYLLLDNEGHSVRDWRNQLQVWRKTESFLANCLGGRVGGPDPIETAMP